MADYPKLTQLHELLSGISNTNVEGLLKNPKWGDFDFMECARPLNRIVTVTRSLMRSDLNFIPNGPLENTLNTLTNVRSIIENLHNFSLANGANPVQMRNEIASQLEQQGEALINGGGLYWAAAVLNAIETPGLISEIVEKKLQAEQFLTELQKYGADKRGEIDKALESARQVAGREGVSVFSRDFSEQAKKHTSAANGWLVATVLLAATTLLLAGGSWFFRPTLTDTPDLINWITTKLIVLGLLVTAVLWCGRLFKTEKHQAAVALHRQHALSTFQAFVSNARDDAMKDAVLLATTQSIFTIASPGYLSGDEGAADGGLKVIEMIKSIAPSVKAS